MNKFLLEVEEIRNKEIKNLSLKGQENFNNIITKIIELYNKQLIKSNHTMMEIVLALYFISQDKFVVLEEPINNNLIADLIVYHENGQKEIIEIETGFVPPEYSSDPILYRYTREISKIARYSKFGDIFSFACPPFHILQIPDIFIKKEKGLNEIYKIKELLDKYYKMPPIEVEEIKEAKINYVYIINVDKKRVTKLDIKEYLEITEPVRKIIEF